MYKPKPKKQKYLDFLKSTQTPQQRKIPILHVCAYIYMCVCFSLFSLRCLSTSSLPNSVLSSSLPVTRHHHRQVTSQRLVHGEQVHVCLYFPAHGVQQQIFRPHTCLFAFCFLFVHSFCLQRWLAQLMIDSSFIGAC